MNDEPRLSYDYTNDEYLKVCSECGVTNEPYPEDGNCIKCGEPL